MSKIKHFPIPSFEEWMIKKDLRIQLGEYYLHIRPDCWGNGHTVYGFAAAADDNPLNIYSKTIFSKHKEIENGNIEELKKWYEETVKQFKEFWENYIYKTYFTEEWIFISKK